jgi:sporulation protein YlmC with PRC-barrel domain
MGRSRRLVLAAAAALTLSAPFLAWSGQTQSGPQYPPGSESGGASQSGMQSQEAAPSNPSGMQQSIPSERGQTTAGTELGRTHAAINPTQYVDKEVVNAKGDKVGEVDRLVINNQTRGVEAVIDVGGFLGIGQKKVVIPLEQLQPKDDKVVLSSTLTQDQLKQSTPYEASEFSAFEPEQQQSQ